MRRFFLYYLPPAAYMAFILILSLRPVPAEPPLFRHADKLNHFAAYAVMGALWMRALAAGKTSGWVVVASISISFVFGAFVEALQSYTLTRDASLLDAAANGVGAVAGAYAFEMFALHCKGAKEV